MKMEFKVGDVVRVNWTYGKVIYCVIRAEYDNWFQVESLNSESFVAMGDTHRRWIRKNNVLSAQ
jgi:hypothetical protein